MNILLRINKKLNEEVKFWFLSYFCQYFISQPYWHNVSDYLSYYTSITQNNPIIVVATENKSIIHKGNKREMQVLFYKKF